MAKTMKRQPKIKNGFYKGYMDEAALRRKTERDAKKPGKPKANVLKVLFEVMVALLRVVGYFVLFLLSSVGLTVLINSDMRIMLIEVFSDVF